MFCIRNNVFVFYCFVWYHILFGGINCQKTLNLIYSQNNKTCVFCMHSTSWPNVIRTLRDTLEGHEYANTYGSVLCDVHNTIGRLAACIQKTDGQCFVVLTIMKGVLTKPKQVLFFVCPLLAQIVFLYFWASSVVII